MEDAAEVRHEFQNGKTIEMVGGTLAHNAIKLRIARKLDQFVEEQNTPHGAQQRHQSPHRSRKPLLLPDVTINDGTPAYYTTPEGHVRRDVIINPLVIVEVLSEDTCDYDKGEKFELYCSVPGFQEYLLIEPEEAWAKSLFLQDPVENLWKHEIFTGKDAVLPIRSFGLAIPLAEIYGVLEKLPKPE